MALLLLCVRACVRARAVPDVKDRRTLPSRDVRLAPHPRPTRRTCPVIGRISFPTITQKYNDNQCSRLLCGSRLALAYKWRMECNDDAGGFPQSNSNSNRRHGGDIAVRNSICSIQCCRLPFSSITNRPTGDACKRHIVRGGGMRKRCCRQTHTRRA